MFKDYALLTRETTLIGGKLSLFLLKKNVQLNKQKRLFLPNLFSRIYFMCSIEKKNVWKSILNLMRRFII